MEKLLKESGEEAADIAFCKKLTRSFNSSTGRAGKPALKWTEVQSWFQNPQVSLTSKEDSVDGSDKSNPDPVPSDKPDGSTPTSEEDSVDGSDKSNPDPVPSDKPDGSTPTSEGEKDPNSSKLEFEAKSSKDGAWYDVDEFKNCRNNNSGEMEALVRFIGFGSDEDEWVNVKESVRERSLGLEHSECHTLKVGDLVLCFQEKVDLVRLCRILKPQANLAEEVHS
uniref:SAWADEE domain-containing protein n=1 Tax=Daucus carota subsp. sativus TaxID=79200 RepID=A0A166FRK7_DAUCS